MKRRSFPQAELVAWFLKHDGICHICGGKILAGQAWEKEHVIPLAQGGEDSLDNMRPAHARPCHARKTAQDAADTARAIRRQARHLGARQSSRPLPGGRKSNLKKRLDGTVVQREPRT